jgi:hypothetical protein
MQHLAVRSGRPLPKDAKAKYPLHTANITCPKCAVAYQLWSPLLESEPEAVRVQIVFLKNYVAAHHPTHANYIWTPDRPE